MLEILKSTAPPFLQLLPDTVVERLRQESSLVKYTDGQLIHSRGEQKPGLSIISSGAACVGIYGIDGSFVITTTLGPGEIFGEFTLFTDLPRTHDISAAGTTEVYQLSSSKFHFLYQQEPEIASALIKTSLSRIHQLLEMLDSMRRLPIREQTAKTLLSMIQLGASSETLYCRQSELAATLGVSRVSLNQALNKLSKLKLLRLGYGQIEIPDVAALQVWVNQNCGETQLN